MDGSLDLPGAEFFNPKFLKGARPVGVLQVTYLKYRPLNKAYPPSSDVLRGTLKLAQNSAEKLPDPTAGTPPGRRPKAAAQVGAGPRFL